jgi:hypothetical protein
MSNIFDRGKSCSPGQNSDVHRDKNFTVTGWKKVCLELKNYKEDLSVEDKNETGKF